MIFLVELVKVLLLRICNKMFKMFLLVFLILLKSKIVYGFFLIFLVSDLFWLKLI